MRYLDYESIIDEDSAEFDNEITMGIMKRHGNFKEGDMLVLIDWAERFIWLKQINWPSGGIGRHKGLKIPL